MIYVIAAYSITIGVLALYGVILQHRARALGSVEVRGGGASTGDPRRGFNLGAALVPPVWMWVHGMRVPGALLGLVCLALVPLYLKAIWVPLLFVVTIPVAASAALGLVGNRIAVAHTGLHEPAAFSASQLPWALTGITLHTVVLPWAWYLTSASG